jgi:hypothetical protein
MRAYAYYAHKVKSKANPLHLVGSSNKRTAMPERRETNAKATIMPYDRGTERARRDGAHGCARAPVPRYKIRRPAHHPAAVLYLRACAPVRLGYTPGQVREAICSLLCSI